MTRRVHADSRRDSAAVKPPVFGREDVLIRPRGVNTLFSARHWPAGVHQSLAGLGQALSPATRAEMESRFGHDFAGVRVHTDSRAADSAGAVNARAYTVGRDVVFGRAEYRPQTSAGRRLLAHELAHVVQQDRGGDAPSLNGASPLERDADRVAAEVVRRPGPIRVRGASTCGLARVPLSLESTLDLPSLSRAQLEHEIGEIQMWLLQTPGGSETVRLEGVLQTLERELARRQTPSEDVQARAPRGQGRPTISAAVRRRDVARIMTVVQRWRVNDAAENEILRIIERHAGSTANFDAFLTDLRNRHYWGGVFGQHYRSGLMAVLQELEGPRLRRFRQLLRQRSHMYGNYRPPEEVTFWGVLWDDVKEGVVAERIFAYLQGMGEAGAAFVRSLVMLITHPDEFARSLLQFPEVVATFWRERRRIWQHFSSASDRDQARMIGRLVGEIEIILATRGAGRAAGPAEAAELAPAAARAIELSATGEAALHMGGTAISAAQLGPALVRTGEAAAHMVQAASISESGPPGGRSPASGGGGSARRAPRRGGSGRRRVRERSPRTEAEIERTLPAEAGTAMEAGEIERWAARLGRGYEVIRNARFPPWLRRLFPGRGFARSGPDMVAINRRTRTIIVGDVTSGPGTTVPMTWRFARQQEAMHIERTIEYARMVAGNLPEELRGFRVFAQERYWELGGRTSRRIPVRP